MDERLENSAFAPVHRPECSARSLTPTVHGDSAGINGSSTEASWHRKA